MTTAERATATGVALLTTLRATELFRGLGERQLEELARVSHRRSLERGDAVFKVGETAATVNLITAGLVKVVRHLPDASEAILGLFGPREAVGLVAVLQERPYPATAIALTARVELVCVRSNEVLEAMALEPTLALSLNRALVSKAQILRTKIDVMSAGAVAQRLASLLASLAERFGDELEDGTTCLPIALSRGELSSLVGARVETTIRILSAWQKQGLVETTREGFIIRDPHTLLAVEHGSLD